MRQGARVACALANPVGPKEPSLQGCKLDMTDGVWLPGREPTVAHAKSPKP